MVSVGLEDLEDFSCRLAEGPVRLKDERAEGCTLPSGELLVVRHFPLLSLGRGGEVVRRMVGG